MRAAPIARYLLELDPGHDSHAGVTPPSGATGAASEASRAAMIEEARAQGFDSGKAAAEAEIAGRLEEREEHFRNELAATREAWAREESGQIAERLVKGLEEIEARLAE